MALAAVRSKAVIMFLLIHLIFVTPIGCLGFVFGRCFMMHFFVPFLVRQLSC